MTSYEAQAGICIAKIICPFFASPNETVNATIEVDIIDHAPYLGTLTEKIIDTNESKIIWQKQFEGNIQETISFKMPNSDIELVLLCMPISGGIPCYDYKMIKVKPSNGGEVCKAEITSCPSHAVIGSKVTVTFKITTYQDKTYYATIFKYPAGEVLWEKEIEGATTIEDSITFAMPNTDISLTLCVEDEPEHVACGDSKLIKAEQPPPRQPSILSLIAGVVGVSTTLASAILRKEKKD